MNVYVVVEGRVVEKEVYTEWIPEINNALSPATYLEDVVGDNHFYIVSGNGYPYYREVIQNALEDIAASHTFHRLVVCVDSEDMTLQEKREEVTDLINTNNHADIPYRIVVQHFCFEVWALGNRMIARRNPQEEALRRYRRFYDVWNLDPEGLTTIDASRFTRSQFAERYLRATLNDRSRYLTYSKRNPEVVAAPTFFHNVRRRLLETGHIHSFQAFLDAFV